MRLNRRHLLGSLAAGAALPRLARAHNNPTFKEELILTIEVQPKPLGDDGRHSQTFALDLPKGTIELIWRLAEGKAEAFSIARGGEVVLAGITPGKNTSLVRGADLAVVQVKGAEGPLKLAVYANIAQWPAR